LTSGPLVEELERRFKAVSGTKYVVALSSGTAVLHSISASLDLKAGGEIVVPANTFASTANAAIYIGAKPILADCDPDSFNVTADSIDRCVTERTKAVIVTHLAGNPCEMNAIVTLCRKKGLVLAEDAAHADGAMYRGRRCGSLAYASAFSLYPTKVITSAEGGMLGTNSKSLHDFAQTFRNAGRAEFGAGPIVALGFNYRMSDIHAAIGLNQLSHIDAFVRKRNHLASVYNDLLSSVEWVRPQRIAKHSVSTYYSYIVLLAQDSPLSRDELARRLGSRGIETTVMFRPIHIQPYFKKFSNGPYNCPNAEIIGLRSLALPMHTGMSDNDVEYVVKQIKEA
jgi:dTDP-4-amino-4,6-dideoxygalactose transaminase